MEYIIQTNYSLKYMNSLRINATGNVAFVFSEKGINELNQDYPMEKFNYVLLGNGSNVLLTKEYYSDEYIFISQKFMNKIELIDDEIFVQAGATLHDLAWFAYEHQLEGYSFMEDIPGCVGGALVMNAGTYNDTIGKLVNKVCYYDCIKQKFETVECTGEEFAKRKFSLVSYGRIFTGAYLKVKYTKRTDWFESELDNMLNIKKSRYLKQPRNYPNAGSVFVRPQPKDDIQYYVWQLIEECGLRGYKTGGCMVSDKHPGFIVNLGNATPDDFLEIIEECKRRVKERFGIDLNLEWKMI